MCLVHQGLGGDDVLPPSAAGRTVNQTSIVARQRVN